MSTVSLDVFVSPMVELSAGGQFSPTSSTLILGETEAILVDTPYMQAPLDEVIERIEKSGRRLKAIVITHGHFDHYFGLQQLLERFPEAQAFAADSVAAAIADGLEGDRKQVEQYFEGAALDNTAVPQPIGEQALSVDGEDVRVIEIEQADVAPTAIVHVPALDAVIAGDAVYNGINLMLAASTPEQWQGWLRSIDQIEALNPKVVVAGHKRPELPDDDVEGTIDATREYIQEFVRALDGLSSARELVKHMQSKFPGFDNASALVLSAAIAMKRKNATNSTAE